MASSSEVRTGDDGKGKHLTIIAHYPKLDKRVSVCEAARDATETILKVHHPTA